MLSRYHATINTEDENNSHVAMLRMIGFNKRVLEGGCASGHMSERLRAQGCRVVGIEIDAAVVEPAMQWLERVVIGNLDDGTLWGELQGELFDVILFGDVLEHLRDPLSALRQSTEHLQPSGMVIISAPNIAHIDVKIALLNGSFPYGESGLLDRTHINFFTKESLLALVKEAGLIVVEVSRVTVPAFGTELEVKRGDVEELVLEAMLKDRESETYQFVIKAVRDDGSRSLEKLSSDLVELTDKLRDEARRYESLRARDEELQAKFDVLEGLHEATSNDLAHFRHQSETIKRVIPKPLLRFLQKKSSQK